MESKILESPSTDKIFVDCGETIKVDDIKEEVIEEEINTDPLSIEQETLKTKVCKDIKEGKKEKKNNEDLFTKQIEDIKKEEKHFGCSNCDKKFSSKIMLLLHNKSGARGGCKYSCKYCEFTFTKENDLNKHLQTNHNVGPKDEIREEFNESFDEPVSGPIERDCWEISKGVSDNIVTELKEKIDNEDADKVGSHFGFSNCDKKPFTCDLCEKSFSYSSYLARHKLTHTGEKNYFCDLCQKSYYSSSDLYRHYKSTIHLNRMECKNTNTSSTQDVFVDCGKKFSSKIMLLLHNKSGGGFKCKYCEFTFMKESDLNKHLQSNHNVAPEDEIMEEVNENESSDDPISGPSERETTKGESDNIVTELKEEVTEGNSFFVQKINNFGDGENNTVVDDIDIVEHKIEIDIN